MISIHAPREGGDGNFQLILVQIGISIHAPREGGDFWPAWVSGSICDFNPRPPRGGRLPATYLPHGTPQFQSTPPARGATLLCCILTLYQELFQSTPPARGATAAAGTPSPQSPISIHAPREGGDDLQECMDDCPAGFQSTPPARGATLQTNFYGANVWISIHAPREGGDCKPT